MPRKTIPLPAWIPQACELMAKHEHSLRRLTFPRPFLLCQPCFLGRSVSRRIAYLSDRIEVTRSAGEKTLAFPGGFNTISFSFRLFRYNHKNAADVGAARPAKCSLPWREFKSRNERLKRI